MSRRRRRLKLALDGAGGDPEPFTFTDDFNRPAENLEASANWTRIGGTAGRLAVSGANQLNSLDTTSPGTAYQCPDIGSPNQYAQAEIVTGNDNVGFVCVRLQDGNNFVGVRLGTGNALEMWKRVAGTLTQLGSGVILGLGDVIRIEANGDSVRALVNGVENLAPVSLSGTNGGITRAGLMSRTSSASPWLDNFEAGTL